MDSKILSSSLLVAVFCLWSSAVAIPGEDKGYPDIDVNYGKGYNIADEDYNSDVHEHKAKVSESVAKAYANKAKVLEALIALYLQMTQARHYYYKEYIKLAEDSKKYSREYEQQARAEEAVVGPHLSRQKEWESKGREADTQAKEMEMKGEQYLSQARELLRNSETAFAAAAIAEADASGFECKAERMADWSRELKRRAENMVQEAKQHYTKGKEDEARAAAEKVKSQQRAEDSQKHFAASRAYDEQAMKVHMAADANCMKYIQNSLLAERARNVAAEDELRGELENRYSDALARAAEYFANIARISKSEEEIFASRAKGEGVKAHALSLSSQEVHAATASNTGALLDIAAAKDYTPIKENKYEFVKYNANDPVYDVPITPETEGIFTGKGSF